jgi:hypothetical protein
MSQAGQYSGQFEMSMGFMGKGAANLTQESLNALQTFFVPFLQGLL